MENTEEAILNIDPVCKMKITSKESVGEVILDECTYYFCSRDCKELFESNPHHYLDTQVPEVRKEVPGTLKNIKRWVSSFLFRAGN